MPVQLCDFDSEAAWETVQILIRWLLQKPADLDLALLCFIKKIYPGSAGQGLKKCRLLYSMASHLFDAIFQSIQIRYSSFITQHIIALIWI